MPTPIYDRTHAASVVLTQDCAKWRLMNFAGVYATDAADVLGVSEADGRRGESMSCITGWSALVEAAEPIPALAWVRPARDGTGRLVVGSVADRCGRALNAAIAAGGLVEMALHLQARGALSITESADTPFFAAHRAAAFTQAAVSPTAVVSLVPTAVAKSVRLVAHDLAPPVGATTDAAGYAVGAKTLNLASAGTGAFYADDVVLIGAQANEYELLAGDSNVGNGGTITLKGYGLYVAVSAAATAITLLRRGPKYHVALNADNDTEGLLTSQDLRSCDVPSGSKVLRLGDEITLRSDVPIDIVHVSANASILANAHRLEATFGV